MKTDIANKYKELYKMIVKAKILGILREIPTYRGNNCYIINRGQGNYDIILPEHMDALNKNAEELTFTHYIRSLPNKNRLKVYGGQDLVSAEAMFKKVHCNELDLSEFDTDNILNMTNMFYAASIDKITFGRFNTRKVLSMESMFTMFKCDSTLDISFDLCEQIYQMFFDARIKELVFSKMQKPLNFCIKELFYGAVIEKLDLIGLDTSRVEDMSNMFRGANLKEINIQNLDIRNVVDMYAMFSDAKIPTLDISNFTPERLITAECIFEGMKTKWVKAYGMSTAPNNIIKQMISDWRVPVFFSERDYKRIKEIRI